jgi:hypothetical protein
MTKITPEHPTRRAIVYVGQSTAYQVTNNLESQRRQYGLVERARQLGWSEVRVIDDDLGRSGAGRARPGFKKLLAAICEGDVGAAHQPDACVLIGARYRCATGTPPSASRVAAHFRNTHRCPVTSNVRRANRDQSAPQQNVN